MELFVRAIPHNSKCRYGERGAADAKPKAGCFIEHFGNADAVPQPPERCLSRQAGIVRCCLRYCAEAGRFNTLKCIWNLSKNSTAARVFPFGQRCRFYLCYC